MAIKLTPSQLSALRAIAAGQADCERLANRVTRRLRQLGLIDWDHATDRLTYAVTDLGKAELARPPRLSARDHKTSVTGTNYVMHLPRPAPYTDYVWCGRQRSTVNSYPDSRVSPYAPEEEEQTCLACIKTRALAGKISPEEA